MTKPLAVVPANDTVAALLVMADVIPGNKAIFVSPAVVNGEQAGFDAVPETVSDNIAAIVESSGSVKASSGSDCGNFNTLLIFIVLNCKCFMTK